MEYQEFVSQIEEKLRTRYKEMGLDYNLSVRQNDVRNKGLCTAIMIDKKQNKSPCKPVVYMESGYDAFKEGMSLDEIVDQIITAIEKEEVTTNLENRAFSKSILLKNLRMELIHKDKNQTLLTKIPHRLVADLALVYEYELGKYEEEVYTTSVTNRHMELLGLTEEELFKAAMECRQAVAPYTIRNMNEILAMDEEDKIKEIVDEMTILTTQDGYHGASCILYPEAIEALSDMKEGNLMLLPCSIHEWIVLPENLFEAYERLAELVKMINREELQEEEILSDHVYFYDVQRQELTVCGEEQEQTIGQPVLGM